MSFEGLPRMRGDPPCAVIPPVCLLGSTPHARGSTFIEYWLTKGSAVYPACAGIHPVKPNLRRDVSCLPRMRGDPPVLFGEVLE